VYKHTIWFRRLKGVLDVVGLDKIKLFVILIGLFFVMFISSLRIVNSINSGIQTQKKADKISLDVKELEKENKNLKFIDSRSKSSVEKESQIRSIEGKKKEGEVLYVISSLTRDQEQDKQERQATKEPVSNTPKLSNWEKWVQKVFN
jgi:hypothetical protein